MKEEGLNLRALLKAGSSAARPAHDREAKERYQG